MISRDQALGALAVEQHNIVDLGDLDGIGIKGNAITRRLRNGTLRRLYAGVYLYGLDKPTKRGRWLAAVKACGDKAILSHRQAAVLHNLSRYDPTIIDVTTPERGRRHKGVRIHDARSLDAADTAEIDGIPTSSVARTLLDLADVADDRDLQRAIHEAEYLRLLDLNAIDAAIARTPGRWHTKRLKEALASYRPLGETGLEDALAALVEQAGFEPPRRNAGVDLGARIVHPDLSWPERRLVIEADGPVHRTTRNFHGDRRRDRELFLVGYAVLRFTDDDILRRRARTLAELQWLERRTRPSRRRC